VRGADENQGSVQFMYCFGGDGEEVDVSGLDMGGKTVPDGTRWLLCVYINVHSYVYVCIYTYM